MLYVTGWVENEPSNTFSTPTDNWTWTWFGAHILLYDIRLIIVGNKNTIFKCSCIKPTGISIFKTIGVNILASTTQIQIILYYHWTVVVPVWSAKSSM